MNILLLNILFDMVLLAKWLINGFFFAILAGFKWQPVNFYDFLPRNFLQSNLNY